MPVPHRSVAGRTVAGRPVVGRTVAGRPVAGRFPTATGDAELVPDRDNPDGWTVMVNGVPSSYVDLADPTRLDFEYMQWMAGLIDAIVPRPEPLRTTHIGGAGCTMARFLAATRPRSVQQVLEIDPDVAQLAREAFGLRRSAVLRIRATEGRSGVARTASGSQDLVLRDAFSGAQVPVHLQTREFLTDVARTLAPGGVYLANLADRPPLTSARAEAATALACFSHVALVAEPSQLRGRRHGNLVIVASETALPLRALDRAVAGGVAPARVVAADDLGRFASQAVLQDGPAPEPDDPA